MSFTWVGFVVLLFGFIVMNQFMVQCQIMVPKSYYIESVLDNTRRGEGLKASEFSSNDMMSACFSPTGQLIYFVADFSIKSYDPSTGLIHNIAGINRFYSSIPSTTIAQEKEMTPVKLLCLEDDHIYYAQAGYSVKTVARVTPGGRIQTIFNPGSEGIGFIAFDNSGSLVFSKPYKNVVARATSLSTYTVLAGKEGVSGSSGDNGLASSALLYVPQGVAYSKEGELYIADSLNFKIRKIDTNNYISTYAGTGTKGSSGDGGLAVNALLNGPLDILVDAEGNVIFSEYNLVKKIFKSTGIIVTIAGKVGSTGSYGEGGLATDAILSVLSISINSDNELLISVPNGIRKVDRNGIITTIVGCRNCPKSPPSLQGYYNFNSYNLDDDGYPILVESSSISMIDVLSPYNPRFIKDLLAPNYTLPDTSKPVLMYVAFYEGSFYAGIRISLASSTLGYLISKITKENVTTFAGVGVNALGGNDGPANSSSIKQANSMALDSEGNIFISQQILNIIRKVDSKTGIISVYGGKLNQVIESISSNNLALESSMYSILRLAVSSNGDLYVLSMSTRQSVVFNVVYKIEKATGKIMSITSAQGDATSNDILASTAALSIKTGGSIYVSPTNEIYISEDARIRKITNDGYIRLVAGTSAGDSGEGLSAKDAQIKAPGGMAMNSNGELVFCDKGNFKIKKIDTNGNMQTIAGIGTTGYSIDGSVAISSPLGSIDFINISPISGDIYFVEKFNSVCYSIRKITNGLIYTVAGGGVCKSRTGWSNDGVLALGAILDSPADIAFLKGELIFQEKTRTRRIDNNGLLQTIIGGDGNGGLAIHATIFPILTIKVKKNYLYISDNQKIRRINFDTGIISHYIGNGVTGSTSGGDDITNAYFRTITDFSIDNNDEMLIADYNDFRTRKVLNNGSVITICGTGIQGKSGNGGLAVKAQSNPISAVQTPQGDILIMEPNGIRIINQTGYIAQFSGTGTYFARPKLLPSQLFISTSPNHFASYGNSIYFADNLAIRKIVYQCNNGFENPKDSNMCICNDGFYGDSCLLFDCFGISSENETSCSSNGICIGPNQCKCHQNYGGKSCSSFGCFGVSANDPLVCSGNGQCSKGNCICNSAVTGLNCEYSSSNYSSLSNSTIQNNDTNISQNTTNISNSSSLSNSTIHNNTNISQNITVENSTTTSTSNSSSLSNSTIQINDTNISQNTTNISNSSSLSNSTINSLNTNTCLFSCNGHGVCVNSSCECFTNLMHGFWEGQNCEKCKNGYFGKECLSKINSPATFLDSFDGIILTIFGPERFLLTEFDCEKLIFKEQLSLFGKNPVCNWVNITTGEFKITFGEDFSLKPGQLIGFNRLVFEENTTATDFEYLTILNAVNPIAPIVHFQGQNVIGPCENFTLDASNSSSADRRSLKFYWSIASSPNNILSNLVLPKTSFLFLDSRTFEYEGVYSFGLQVESSVSGEKSKVKIWTVSRLQFTPPVVSVIGSKNISIFKSEAPLIIKKAIDIPHCFYVNQELSISWEQTQGPYLVQSIYIDSLKDITITKFQNILETNYQLMVKTSPVINPNMTSFDVINITVKPTPLSLQIYSDEVSNESGYLFVNFVDPDLSTETEIWKWECLELSNNSSCGPTITSILLTNAMAQSNSFLVSSTDLKSLQKPTLQFSLTISKGKRSISSSFVLTFPQTGKIPPTISLISVTPMHKLILQEDLLSLQFSVTAGGVSLGIEQYIIRTWTLNGKKLNLSDNCLNRMSLDPILSNSIVIDGSMLDYYVAYSLQFTVSDIRNGLSDSYTHNFSLASPPPACPCSITPSSGIALETTFVYFCTICQNNIQISYGFIDDKSGTIIELYQKGGTYSTKLPYASSKILTVYFKITDLSSGASIRITKNIDIVTASVKTVVDIKKKLNTYSAQIATNNLVFNSASISRVTDTMLAKITGTKRYQHYIMDAISDQKEIRIYVMNQFIQYFESRNIYETITTNYLSIQALSLEYLMENYNDLDEYSMFKGYEILTELVSLCENKVDFRIPRGVDKVLVKILNSIFNFTKNRNDQTIMPLVVLLKRISNLLLRGLFVGERDLTLLSNFAMLSSNNLFRNDFSSRIISTIDGTMISLPKEMPSFLNEKSNRKIIPLTCISLIELFGLSNITLSSPILKENITTSSTHIERNTSSTEHIRSNIVFLEIDSAINSMEKEITYNISLFSIENYGINTLISSSLSNNSTVNVFKSSQFYCRTIDNSTLKDLNCTVVLVSQSFAICTCYSVRNLVLVEKVIERVEVISTLYSPSTPNSFVNNESLGIILGSILGLSFLLIVILFLLGISKFIWATVKKEKQTTQKTIEMQTV